MTQILKFFSQMFGYDYKIVKEQPTQSRQKIVSLGTLLMLPVALWGFSGFYLTHFLLGAGLPAALFTGVILAGIIFIIDRSFITAPITGKSKYMRYTRIGFALFSTFLGSLAIDLMIFSGDLDEYRSQKSEKIMVEEKSKYLSDHAGDLATLKADFIKAEAYYHQKAKDYQDEIDGKGGTGYRGLGDVAAEKKEIMDDAKVRMDSISREIAKADFTLKAGAESYASKLATKRDDALLSKIKDLHSYVFSDGLVMFVYGVLFVFVFLIEIFFLLFKESVAQSHFEEYVIAEELYARERMKAYQTEKEKLQQTRSLLGRDSEQIRRIV